MNPLRIRDIATCLLIVISIFGYGCALKTDTTLKENTEVVAKDIPEDMVLIPAGEFIMGSDEVDKEALHLQFGMPRPLYLNEHPAHKVMLDDYYIDRYEVTNRKYKEFINDTGHTAPSHWINTIYYPAGSAEFPVSPVTWYSADAFCIWAGKRLPTEAEWEKAARGTDGLRFPWGDEFDEKKANALGLYGDLTKAGLFEEGVSPYKVYDMAGNVSEWTSDWYKPYPDNDFKDEDYGEVYRVARGGGWGGIGHYSFDYFYRTATRIPLKPSWSFYDVGFRCAKSNY
ncbi:MAG: formylglycine-generating enzyme family protein [Thermodesulfobacteriota bacterium]